MANQKDFSLVISLLISLLIHAGAVCLLFESAISSPLSQVNRQLDPKKQVDLEIPDRNFHFIQSVSQSSPALSDLPAPQTVMAAPSVTFPNVSDPSGPADGPALPGKFRFGPAGAAGRGDSTGLIGLPGGTGGGLARFPFRRPGGKGWGMAQGTGQGFGAPRLQAGNPPPTYPAGAIRQKLQGTAVLQITIQPDGTVAQVQVEASSGHDILDQAAIEAVRNWRFEPPARQCVAVLPVRFSLTPAK